ncbi:hypothetical protein LAZ67_4001989 [Cordylochernes scorpioides]|uniref:Uncharacterized protein n=1 Tax=Cordylochernes scorpioides TaxID=51811 RepID=A0ABY6KCN7_9ARAC|nr:hypothetical protein LAZ67_4001989 [Cordylochernes scorpioides]
MQGGRRKIRSEGRRTKLRGVLQASCCLKRSDCCLPPTPVYFLEDSGRFYELCLLFCSCFPSLCCSCAIFTPTSTPKGSDFVVIVAPGVKVLWHRVLSSSYIGSGTVEAFAELLGRTAPVDITTIFDSAHRLRGLSVTEAG